MDWPTAAELLQRPPADPTDHLRWLGRFGRDEALLQRAKILRVAPAWNARWALELAMALRLAGDPQAADALILEADRLEPSLALLPDPWGLWPAPAAAPEDKADALVARGLLQQLRAWRWLDAGTLEQGWIEQASGTWPQGLDETDLDQLALVLHQGEGRAEAFRQKLIQLVGEAEMAAHPGSAAAFWGFVADAVPDWDYALLKAADLALQRGQHQRCAAWLHEPSGALAANPWCHDLAARLALVEERISDALAHWGEAIVRCSALTDSGQPQLVEVFRQRRREARRGPGVLQARALIDRGATTQARALLVELVEQDPQWQPLRTLLAQVDQAPTPTHTPTPEQSPAATTAAGYEAALAQFSGFLERIATQRRLPLQAVADSPASSLDTQQQRLEAFAANLGEAEGRLALRS